MNRIVNFLNFFFLADWNGHHECANVYSVFSNERNELKLWKIHIEPFNTMGLHVKNIHEIK